MTGDIGGRVAVLSDIHGALPALEAVLAEPDVRAADLVVLTGDIAAGPQPTRVLDLLVGLGERVARVGGNADRELLEHRRGTRDVLGDPVSRWAAKQLRPDHLDPLAHLPRTHCWADYFLHARATDNEVLDAFAPRDGRSPDQQQEAP